MPGPSFTPTGELLVEVTLTEDVWDSVRRALSHYGSPCDLAEQAIRTSVLLARHHAKANS